MNWCRLVCQSSSVAQCRQFLPPASPLKLIILYAHSLHIATRGKLRRGEKSTASEICAILPYFTGPVFVRRVQCYLVVNDNFGYIRCC